MRIPVRAIIFDCDGTLFDSEQPWLDVVTELAAELNADLAALPDIRGISAQDLAHELAHARVPQSPSDQLSVQEIHSLLDTRYSERLAHIDQPLPGVREFLESLRGQVALGVASNGLRHDVEAMLHNSGLRDYFEVIVTVEDVPAAKPDPAMYLLSASRLGINPADIVVVEDSAHGCAAGHKAGATVIGLGSDPSSLPLADKVVTSMQQLHFDSSRNEVLIRGSESAQDTWTLHTWNLWWGGTKVSDGARKLYETAQALNADVLATQECFGEHSQNLSRSLGFNHVQQGFDCAISSRFALEPISTETEPFGTAAWITIGDKQILLWSVHLAAWDYGPYAALTGGSAEHIAQGEQEIQRRNQITAILAETERLIAHAPDGDATGVIIAGDFNSPATADWMARSDLPDMQWIPTDAPLAAGFEDAFRVVYPDPTTVWGDTWSLIEPLGTEPRDRIDFVFSRNLEIVGARVIGPYLDDDTPAPDDAPAFTGATTVGAAGLSRKCKYNAPELNPESAMAAAVSKLPGKHRARPYEADNPYPSDHQIVEITFLK